MKLFIDTSNPDFAILELHEGKNIFQHKFKSKHNLSERLIGEIKKFLEKRKFKLTNLKKIDVKSGPGYFSRLRSGVATANALAYSLHLPQKLIHPIYNKSPNITLPKKRVS